MITPKMKSCRTQILSLILGGLIAQPAQAEVIPGRWEKVSALEMASPIVVELNAGDRIKGQFRGLSASDLDLLSPSGWAVIPKSDIRTITSPSKDGLGDGAKRGAAIGAGLAVVTAGTGAITANGGNDASPIAALMFAGFAAGIGAGLGTIADAATKTDDIILYIAPGTPRRPQQNDSEWWPPDPAGRDGGTPKFTMLGRAFSNW